MRHKLILCLPLVPAVLMAAPAAFAQNNQGGGTGQRDVAMAQEYNFSAEEWNKERVIIADLRKQIGETTELVKGCELLRTNLTHLKTGDTLLGRMEVAAKEMKRRKEAESATKQRKDVVASIEITEADIARMCSGV